MREINLAQARELLEQARKQARHQVTREALIPTIEYLIVAHRFPIELPDGQLLEATRNCARDISWSNGTRMTRIVVTLDGQTVFDCEICRPGATFAVHEFHAGDWLAIINQAHQAAVEEDLAQQRAQERLDILAELERLVPLAEVERAS